MMKKVGISICSFIILAFLSVLLPGLFVQKADAQSAPPASQTGELKSLRSDVGIHGLTANFHFLNDISYLGDDTLSYDGSSELEFVYRNVRMMSPHVGVGYQVLTSFFVNGPESEFGVGSWGLGPVVRAYPLKSDRFQPYVQANALFGRNFGLGTLANTREVADGFRFRFGLRGGLAVRLSNTIGLFTEVGYDWESSIFFKADSRALQGNVGIDFYLFN